MTFAARGARPRPNSLTLVQRALSILAVFNLAVAQPLLDVLRRHAEFFVAHDATGSDILVLVVALTLLAPLALWSLTWLAARLHPTLGSALHAAILATLVASLTVQLLARVPVVEHTPGSWLVAVALAVGTGSVIALHRAAAARFVVMMAWPLPLLVAGLFLFSSPVSKLLFPATVSLTRPQARDKPPVVMMVFDELPLASLMNEEGGIDGRLFPNFARLAHASTWFRNTTAVDIATTRAIPALLDGRYPRRGRLPVVQDHPQNLFTLLAPGWKVTAFEPITQLCPARLCEKRHASDSEASKWKALLADTAIVALHVILPDDLAGGFPPVDEAWGAFAEPGGGRHGGWWTDRLGYFRHFVDSIAPTPEPALYFIHSPLPHAPWKYLPSGQQYRPPLPDPARGERGWGNSAWLVTQAYQRHLLQVVLVDKLLGEAVRALRDAALYDRALIVVASDHGISFRPNAARRATGSALAEIAPVPLFVKRPFQSKPAVIDRPVQTIDVLPTIADLLRLQLPASIDGTSAFAGGGRRATRFIAGSGEVRRIPPSGPDKIGAAQRKYELFARKNGVLDLFEVGPRFTRQLVGRGVHSVELGPPLAAAVRIQNLHAYKNVDPEAEELPSLVRGRITGRGGLEGATLAVAVNGKIAAVTRTFDARDGGTSFYSVLPPRAFVSGANEIEVFFVDTEVGGKLRPLRHEQAD